MLHRRGYAPEIAYRAKTEVEVHELSYGDVEASDAAADRCRKRAFYPYKHLPERLQRFFGEPLTGLVMGLAAGEHLDPLYFPPAPVGLAYGFIKYAHGRPPDIGPCTVADNERDLYKIGYGENTVVHNRFLITVRHLPPPALYT